MFTANVLLNVIEKQQTGTATLSINGKHISIILIVMLPSYKVIFYMHSLSHIMIIHLVIVNRMQGQISKH